MPLEIVIKVEPARKKALLCTAEWLLSSIIVSWFLRLCYSFVMPGNYFCMMLSHACKMRIRKRKRYRKASTHTQNKQQLCDRENFCNAKEYKYFGIILNFLYLYIR